MHCFVFTFIIETVIETDLSDHHKLIATFFKLHFTRLDPKIVYYSNLKRFDKNSFLNNLKDTNFDLSFFWPVHSHSPFGACASYCRAK